MGARAMTRDRLNPEQDAAYRQALTRAAEAGAAVLAAGRPGLDAVEAALHVLEDDPLFNAGRGAAFSAAGRNEMDAAIMNGADLQAGLSPEVTGTRHPITLARAVMEQSDHVLLTGDQADAFAVGPWVSKLSIRPSSLWSGAGAVWTVTCRPRA